MAGLHAAFQQQAPWIQGFANRLADAFWPVAIITLKNRTISPVAKLAIECAREAAGLLAKDHWWKK